MKKKLLFFVLSHCIFFIITAHGQGWQWAKQAYNIDSWLAKTDKFNNIYVGGVWQSDSISLGTKTYYNYHKGPNNYETVLAKYDSSGALAWSCASVLGQAWPISITTDNIGNMYFFGCFWTDSVQFGSTVLINKHLDSCVFPCIYGQGCYFIIKFDVSGNIVWAKTGDNISGPDGGIAVDKAGNIYVTSTFSNSIIHIGPYTLHNTTYKYGDILLAKYDTSGNELWAKSYGGSLNEGSIDIAIGTEDKLYLTGGFTSPTTSFGGTTLSYSGSFSIANFLLVKLDTSGNPIWAKSSIGSAIPYSVKIDGASNIYAGGRIYDSSFVAFEHDTIKGPTIEGSGFLVKYDILGNEIWSKCIFNKTSSVTTGPGGNYVYGITTDLCNNVWVSGKMSGDTAGIFIDSGLVLRSPVGSYDQMFFTGYTASGKAFQYSSYISGGDDWSQLETDNVGNIYLSADTWKKMNLGKDTVTPGKGGECMFLAKYNPNLIPTIIIKASPADTVCAGATVTYSATTGGPSPPGYKWIVNGVAVGVGSSYAYVPANGDSIRCISTGIITSCTTISSVSSNTIYMVVNPLVAPSISIRSINAESLCTGASVTFAASVKNEGSSPVYQWKVNGALTGTGSTYTYTPVNGDSISCTLTSSDPCASPSTVNSNVIYVAVDSYLTPSITLSAPPTAKPSSTVTVTATVTGAGSSYSINWMNNGVLFSTTAIPTVSYTKSSGTDLITAVVFPSGPCNDSGLSVATTISAEINTGIISTQSSNSADIYPNPTSSECTITYNGTVHADAQISIYDITGRLWHTYRLTGSNTIISTADLSPGMYQCRIDVNGSGTVTRKLVVMK